MKKIITFLSNVFGPLVLGFISSLFFDTKSFKVIKKPPLAPPAIVFPIVWSILYLLMGIGLYIFNKNNGDKRKLLPFYIQLGLNISWSFVFFSFKLYYLSIVWLLAIIYFTIETIINFYSTKKIAGILQFPYLIWLLIALYLNIGVAILN